MQTLSQRWRRVAAMTRAGFVGLAGRPNVGKSTLVNAIVGAKVAIVSDRPQTTRRAIRGIATDPAAGWQMVLVDLPGVQRPRDSLTERMQRRVERELADADAALLVVDGHQGVGPGDRFIAKALLRREAGDPRGLRGQQVRPARARRRPPPRWPRPPSSRRWTRCSRSAPRRGGPGAADRPPRRAAPGGPLLYPPEDRSDLPSEVHLAELVREQVLRRTRDEVPHAVEVVVERGRAERERRPGRGARPGLGRDAVPEGHPGRQGRADGARDRHRGAQGARAGPRSPGLPGPPGQGPRALASRRRPARPNRDRGITPPELARARDIRCSECRRVRARYRARPCCARRS